jgi:hypothetical protein
MAEYYARAAAFEQGQYSNAVGQSNQSQMNCWRDVYNQDANSEKLLLRPAQRVQ